MLRDRISRMRALRSSSATMASMRLVSPGHKRDGISFTEYVSLDAQSRRALGVIRARPVASAAR